MEILVISQRKILPTLDGALIGSLGLIKYLKDMRANTTLVTFTENEDYSEAERAELLKYVSALYSCPLRWKNTALNLSFKYPNNVRKYTRRAMQKLINKIKANQKFDLVIIDHLQLFEYAKLFTDERIVLHTHNVESNIWEEYAKKCKGLVRLLVSRSARMTYEYEQKALSAADGVTACSDTDLEVFKRMSPDINGAVMHSYNKFDRVKEKEDVLNRTNTIVFVGSYGWYPNQSAARFLARELMPELTKHIPDIRLVLVGKDPTDEIKEYAAENPRITVTGTVESIDPYIKSADVFVNAVMEGSGINIKIIEAMGKGIPIVSSAYGVRGLDIQSGKEALIYENVDECVRMIEELITNREKAFELSVGARAYYEKFIQPEEQTAEVIFGTSDMCSGKCHTTF